MGVCPSGKKYGKGEVNLERLGWSESKGAFKKALKKGANEIKSDEYRGDEYRGRVYGTMNEKVGQ